MPQSVSDSMTRRNAVAALTATSLALLAADNAYAQTKPATPEKTGKKREKPVRPARRCLRHRCGGGSLQRCPGEEPRRWPAVQKNPQLREWHTKNLERLPGLKFMRTLWVCDASGGPMKFTGTKPGSTPLGLEEAHRNLRISPAEFDAVAAELGRTLDRFKVPKREKDEVLAAFAAHKDVEVTAGAATVGKSPR